MRLSIIVALFLCSCDPTETEMERLPTFDSKDVEILEQASENFCKTSFVTKFDILGTLFTPIDNRLQYSLQVSTTNGRSDNKKFAQNQAECAELYKVVTPYIFTEPRGKLKNDVSVRIDIDKTQTAGLIPGGSIAINPDKVELVVQHQLAFFGNEKNANTVVRTNKIPGSLGCKKPFMVTCEPSRKQKTCGPLVITPPNESCPVKFSDFSGKVSSTATLKGNLAGKIDFTKSSSDKQAYLVIEEIDSLTLAKDRMGM